MIRWSPGSVELIRPIACGLKCAICAILLSLAIATGAEAQSISCPLAEQKPMLVFQLFFGRSVPNRGPVTATEWSTFLRQSVTPRFPDGFTVYDAYGQWLDAQKHSIIRESTKVIVIAAIDTPEVRAKVAEVSENYRKLFHQQSVGIVTTDGCGAF
jgi:uncharacterized protein DUF3574